MDGDRIVTRDDLIKGGLCLSGVNAVMRRIGPLPAAMPISELMQKLNSEQAGQVLGALELNGYGNGYGNGDGYGYGNGYGYGYGYGYEDDED